MSTWIQSIMDGFNIYTQLASLFFLPLGLIAAVKKDKINPMRFVLTELFSLYMVIVFALVFLPLPSMEEAMHLSYRYQLIPFMFIPNMIKEPCISAVLGVIFNILMTIPFGMFLSYYFGLTKKQVILAGFLLTLIIEVGQLTGLFFLYQGSYRLFDMDDLIQNTFGSYLGYLLVARFGHLIPELSYFDITFVKEKVTLRPEH